VLGVRAADKSKIFVVMTPAGPSFPDGFLPLELYVEPSHSRSYYGGTSNLKIATYIISKFFEALEIIQQQ
jgi:branched-chain amino acid aminotransferase